VTKRLVLVAGAGNFVGMRVMSALAACGWAEPAALDALAPPAPEMLRGALGIVNAAAAKPRSILALARLAADAARSGGAQLRAVHLSSMTVYGAVEGPIDETAALRADLGDYAAAHIEAERIIAAHANAVILRPGCEYGAGCPQWSGRIARLLYARRLGDLGLAGDGCCNLLYIDDLVSAILASLRKPDLGGEIFNLAVRSPPTWNDYLIRYAIALRAVPVRRITARRLKAEAKLFAVPLKSLEILAARVSRTSLFSMPAITPSLLRLCRQRIVLDVGKAEARLGLAWTPPEQGLALAAQAYAEPRPR
jgi:nucleoside-diphosphate-sugar epimerase